MDNETWIRLSVIFPAPDDEHFERYLFEEEIYALLESYGCATVNEQDATTLDGKNLPDGAKALQCYFNADQSAKVAEIRSHIGQTARKHALNATAQIETFSDNSWKDGWKAYFKPAQVSDRIAIRAPWCEFEAKEGVKTIVIEPGMAFGTGLHETTQLCIRAIDKITRNHAMNDMLDVGCGSGVLSIAGALCGIPGVDGIDIDPVCIDVSNENAKNNGVSAHFSRTDIWDIEKKYDLVVANIISSVLKSLADDMAEALRPGGYLVLSGILAEELGAVQSAFEKLPQLRAEETQTMGEWSSIVFVKTLSH